MDPTPLGMADFVRLILQYWNKTGANSTGDSNTWKCLQFQTSSKPARKVDNAISRQVLQLIVLFLCLWSS